MTPLLWFAYLLATAGGILIIGIAVFLLLAIIGWARKGETTS